MTFKTEHCADFLILFEKYKAKIRAAEGCEYLELLREGVEGSVFFTYSHWSDASYLDKYRKSQTFAEVWPLTKAMFALPAEAWTSERLFQLK